MKAKWIQAHNNVQFRITLLVSDDEFGRSLTTPSIASSSNANWEALKEGKEPHSEEHETNSVIISILNRNPKPLFYCIFLFCAVHVASSPPQELL